MAYMASPSYPDDASPDTAERPKPLSEESPLLPHAVGEPDSWYGWLVVCGAFMIFFVAIGGMYSFGVFILPIGEEFGVGRGDVSWVGSVGACLQTSLGPLTGRVSEKIGFRLTTLLGAVLMGLGYFTSGLVTSVWLLLITYGVFVGVGMSLAFLPCLACTSQWFEKRRGLAMGLGSGIGNMLLPPALEAIIDGYNWRVTFMVTAVASVVIVAISGLPFKMRFHSAATFNFGPLIKDPRFLLFYTVVFLGGYGYLVPFVHAAPLAKDLGLTDQEAALALSEMGLASTIGRVVMGSLGDCIGTFQMLVGSMFVLAASMLYLSFVTAAWELYLFCFVYGCFAGSFIAVLPVLLAEVFGVVRMASVTGLIYSAAGISGLIGPAVTGWLFDLNGNYTVALWLAAAGVLASCVVLCCFPLLERRGHMA